MSEPQQESSLSYTSIRILHNIGDAGTLISPKIDIYLDSKVIAYNLSYGDFTAYISVLAGDHTITAKQANTDIIVAQAKVRFYDGSFYTAIIVGNLNDPQSRDVLVNQDNLRCPRPGNCNIRFTHGVAGFDNVNVYSGDDLLFENVSFGESTNYKELKPGYSKLGIVRVGQPIDTKTEIANPLLVSGGVYSIILSLNAPEAEYVLRGIVADDTRGSCEQLQNNFKVPDFMGKWYLISSIPQIYDNNCPRATAEYTQLQDYIRIVNTCYNEDWVANYSVSGKGIQEPCGSASLRVTFPHSDSISHANYLIHRTDYDGYALVGTPTRKGLWILSRKAKMSLEEYQRLVHYARRLGYDVSLLRVKYHALTRSCKRSSK